MPCQDIFVDSQSQPLSLADSQRLVHELRVHQVELQAQNEELRLVHVELETSRARYVNLYDLAPAGYCTVSPAGIVVQANLTLASLLGEPRGALVYLKRLPPVAMPTRDICSAGRWHCQALKRVYAMPWRWQ